MKKSTFLLFSLLIALAAFSQNNHQHDQFIFDGMPEDGFFDPYQRPTQRQGALKNATKEMDNVVSRPDSTIEFSFNKITGDSTYSYKTIYIYDEYGNKTSSINYKWDKNEQNWLNHYKDIYVYNVNNKQTSRERYKGENGEWILYYTIDFEYDADKTLSQLVKQLDSNNDTVFEESVYSYELNPDAIIIETYQWTNELSTKQLIRKNIYYYDNNGNDSIQLYESYENQSIARGDIQEYFYIDNALEQYISSTWDPDSNKYVFNSKVIYEYETSGEEKFDVFMWNTENQDWNYTSSGERDFNSDGEVLNLKVLIYDDFSNLTAGSKKTDWDYNGFNDIVSQINYDWDTTSLDWIPYYKNEKKRSNDGAIYAVSTSKWNMDNSEWYVIHTTYYYYHGWSLSVNSATEKNGVIYPNPAKDFIYVPNPYSWKEIEIEIYSLSGKRVFQTISNNTTSRISIDNFPHGIYFLQVTTEGKNEIHKIIKN